MDGIDWDLLKTGCPRCGAKCGGAKGVHWNGAAVWCLGCGWAKNWKSEPAKEARADG